MSLDQVAIMLTGVLAAWLNQDARSRVRRWGSLIGLAGQPFWLWANWHAGQWGMFAVSLGYTVAFTRGLRSAWVSHG